MNAIIWLLVFPFWGSLTLFSLDRQTFVFKDCFRLKLTGVKHMFSLKKVSWNPDFFYREVTVPLFLIYHHAPAHISLKPFFISHVLSLYGGQAVVALQWASIMELPLWASFPFPSACEHQLLLLRHSLPHCSRRSVLTPSVWSSLYILKSCFIGKTGGRVNTVFFCNIDQVCLGTWGELVCLEVCL